MNSSRDRERGKEAEATVHFNSMNVDMDVRLPRALSTAELSATEGSPAGPAEKSPLC